MRIFKEMKTQFERHTHVRVNWKDGLFKSANRSAMRRMHGERSETKKKRSGECVLSKAIESKV